VFDVMLLGPARVLNVIGHTSGPQVVADGHAEPVRNQLGKPQDDNDSCAKATADSAGNDAKRGHATVDGTQDSVPQVVVFLTGNPVPNLLWLVLVFKFAPCVGFPGPQ
jgi:hypothetical protein